ncbi:sensor histidine kinase [Flindersiella endophytica]
MLTTPFVAGVVAIPMWLLAAPILPALAWARNGQFETRFGSMAVLTLLAAALLTAFGPLVAAPLGYVERLRLQLGDSRPVADPPNQPFLRWIRTRYTSPSAWREFGYAALLVTAIPLLYLAVAIVGMVDFVWIISPLLVSEGDSISIGFATISSAGEAIPFTAAGLLLLPAMPYLWTLLSATHVAIARSLLLPAANEELRTELVEVTRSRARLVDAFEAERRRIERDLHDGAQQKLVSLTMQLGLAKVDLPAGSPAATAVADAHEQAKQLMAQLRELIRGIHPRVLSDRGLPAAIGELTDHVLLPIDVNVSLPDRLPSHVEATGYFVVAEALNNVAKHSGASSASVTARLDAGMLVVEVVDDGQGGADPYAGASLTGLAGLVDRVSVVGGKMYLSSPDGGPTVVRVEIPCGPSRAG